jgi:hypothetical protein
MSRYHDFIKQFEVMNNPPQKRGYSRHHIFPVSEQIRQYGQVIDNTQIYVTKAQHLWAHILYDQENETNTCSYLIGQSHLVKNEIKSYEDCLSFNDIPDGMYGKHHTEESRKKMSDSSQNKNLGRHLSEETKKKISNTLTGHEVSEETRKKISESHKGNTPWNKGVPISEETRKKLSEKSKGHRAWNKGLTASDETKRKISESLKGNNRHLGHHHIEETKKKISEKGNRKTVLQFTKDGQFIKEYPSVREASKQNGIRSSSISNCCLGRNKSAGGFVWKYKDK